MSECLFVCVLVFVRVFACAFSCPCTELSQKFSIEVVHCKTKMCRVVFVSVRPRVFVTLAGGIGLVMTTECVRMGCWRQRLTPVTLAWARGRGKGTFCCRKVSKSALFALGRYSTCHGDTDQMAMGHLP